MALMSFGFKYGVPLDADFVFDLRFLPNPFWIPSCATSAARTSPSPTSSWARRAPEFIDRVVDLMRPVTAGYIREGRRYVTIGIGCTGGKHRSVAISEALALALSSPDVGTFVVHRDLGHE